MAGKQVFGTSHVPLSPAVRAGDMVYVSGQVPVRAGRHPESTAASRRRRGRCWKTSRPRWLSPAPRMDRCRQDHGLDPGGCSRLWRHEQGLWQLLPKRTPCTHHGGVAADDRHQGRDRSDRLRTLGRDLRRDALRCASSPPRSRPRPIRFRRSRPTAPPSRWPSTPRPASIPRRRRCAPRRWWRCAAARAAEGLDPHRRHRDLGRAGRPAAARRPSRRCATRSSTSCSAALPVDARRARPAWRDGRARL